MAITTNHRSLKLIQSLIRPLNSLSPPSTTTQFCQTTTIKNTTTSTTTTVFPPPQQPTSTVHNTVESVYDFEDTKRLFSSVPTYKLIRSTANLGVASVETVVDLGMWVMNCRLMDVGLFRELVLGVIKHTVYEHFVAGADSGEVGRTVKRLWDSGLRGMLDYGLEHAVDNESCDRNAQQIVNTVESTQFLPPSSVSFVVVKITAICPVSLLKRVSDLLRWEYKNPSSFLLPWKRKTLPIFVEFSAFYHTLEKPSPLTATEESDLELAYKRLTTICDKALESNVPVVIDAEDTSIQPGIDYFTYSAVVEYNKGEKPLVSGTIQAYLKDAGQRLFEIKKAADKMGLPIGFKLVRGAYMSSERKLANSLGVESPIHNSIDETHHCFNECASYMLDEVSNGPGGLILATHNLESDAMSFGLRNAGFGVSKYLPFGPVSEIMPYLLRRAEENKGLLSSSYLDRHLMMRELKRRVNASVWLGLTGGSPMKTQATSIVEVKM